MSRQLDVPSFVYWISAPFLWTKLAIQKRAGVLRPLEQSVLEVVLRFSDEPLASALTSQLSEINHALRVTAKYSEVNLYKIRGVRPDLTRANLLPVDVGDVLIAAVVASVEQFPLMAKVYSVDRRLFSIEFDRDVRFIEKRAELSLTSVSILGRHVFGKIGSE